MEGTVLTCIIAIMYKCDWFIYEGSLVLKDLKADTLYPTNKQIHREVCSAVDMEETCHSTRIRHFVDSVTLSSNPKPVSKESLDLHGRTLILSAMDLVPFIYRDDQGVVRGSEYGFVKMVSEQIGFDVKVVNSDPSEFWGKFNQSLQIHDTGAIGILARLESDMSIGQHLLDDIKMISGIESVHSYESDGLCFLIRREQPKRGWMSLISPLDQLTWIGTGVSLLAGIGFIYIFSLVKSGDPHPWLTVLALLLGQASDVNKSSAGLKVFLFSFLMATMILKSGYSGTLFAFLTVDILPEGIKTLQELDHSDKAIWTSMAKNVARFRDAGYTGMSERHVQVEFNEMFELKASQDDAALFETASILDYEIRLRYIDENGEAYMRRLEQCWNLYNVGILLQDRSIYREVFQMAFLRLTDGGVYRWSQDIYLEQTGRMVRPQERTTNQNIPIKLLDLRFPFVLWSSGILISFMFWVIEAVAHELMD
ncbi:uncharacterized protein LOC131876831 isoform X1 [Tigriopus californicus]|uniref:uncharacterized protein LOC131876831 isoform X1 n=1 Tax=Tigriopus californicus TaxID=6832 RepID=UPI0027DA2ED2|nr:uncharacterized protein LOC131876831 isoform X1 [Tigriopus californicus]